MEGTALPPNYEEAHRWCEVALRSKIALSEEHAKAAFCLGHLYRNGLGTPKNPSRALALLRQGADFGIVPAMEETADMLANGEAGKADRQEALIYLLRAMLKGDKTAQRKATDIRAQTSDQDWKKIDKEIRRRFNGSPAVLDALLESIQNPAAK
jgi:TPR repeat protein